jgi:hypothetical protein
MKQHNSKLRVSSSLVFAFLLTGSIFPARGQSCSTPGFSQPAVYAVGTGDTRATAAADFDGDGKPDLAIADNGGDTLIVLTKVGTGAPPSINSFSAGHQPFILTVGDFNSDGKPDLVVSNSSGLLLMLNNGLGGFLAAGTFGPAGSPTAVVAGDFNGDGKPDIAASFTPSLMVFLGNGQGGFGAAINTAANVFQLTIADFNGDGKLDLAGSGDPIQILFGNGDGTFVKQASSCTGSSARDGIAAGDLNNDGKPDLVWADVLAARINRALNNGSGCFGSTSFVDSLNQGRPRVVTLGDLNNDGRLDIVAGTTVLLGDGTGTLGTPFFYGTGSNSGSPGANSVLADFDGDGKLDIGVAGPRTATILFGDGQGGVKFAVGPGGAGVFAFDRGDFNGDGKPDLVFATLGSVSVALGNGAGGFGPPSRIVTPATPTRVVVADFNGDSKLDIGVLAPGASTPVFVLIGSGDGHFSLPLTTSVSANEPVGLATGDFNNDTKPDLVVMSRSGGINNGGTISVMLGNGNGFFAAGTPLPVNVQGNAKKAVVADLNGDGKIDLAIPSGFGFSVMLGDGTGGFGTANLNTTANSTSIVTGDFNNDGKTDLAMVNQGENKISVLLGNGNGSFGTPIQITTAAFAEDLTVADFNGDGKLDLGVSNANGTNAPIPTTSVLFGDGAGNFSIFSSFVVEASPSWILSGDFNSDGRNDLISASSLANNISLMLNACSAPVSSTPTFQFAAPTFLVGEGGGSATITVNRTGSTIGTASVSYATSDGSASSRSDYMPAFGRLSFADGESSKSFQVLIVDDTTPESNESLNVTLNSPSGATLAGTFQATVVIQENDSTFVNSNPIDTPSFFVRQHYLDFLNREADQAGLNFWTGQMTNCGSSNLLVCRVNVSAAFFVSIEFQQTGYLVERMYKTAYGDATAMSQLGGLHQIFVPMVRTNEFLADTQRVGRGVIVNQGDWQTQLENNKQAYALEFVQTSRFISAFPTNMTPSQFVDKLNANAGNVLSASERTTAINLFGSNAADTTNVSARSQALRQVAEDADLQSAEFNRAFVLSQFIGYLRRNPNDAPDSDYTGYDFWLGKLNQFNGNYIDAEMVKAFISSDEYRHRFGP